MQSVETRKRHTELIIDYVRQKMFRLTGNDAVSGYIIFILHHVIVCLSFTYILVGEINWLFYLIFAAWIAAFNVHLYFNGCILTRLERALWNTRDWSGTLAWMFSPASKTDVEMTPNLVNNIFICCGIVVFMVGFLRFLYSLN
jgi:hypothetical protein